MAYIGLQKRVCERFGGKLRTMVDVSDNTNVADIGRIILQLLKLLRRYERHLLRSWGSLARGSGKKVGKEGGAKGSELQGAKKANG